MRLVSGDSLRESLDVGGTSFSTWQIKYKSKYKNKYKFNYKYK